MLWETPKAELIRKSCVGLICPNLKIFPEWRFSGDLEKSLISKTRVFYMQILSVRQVLWPGFKRNLNTSERLGTPDIRWQLTDVFPEHNSELRHSLLGTDLYQ